MILLLGATGATGQHLLRQLLDGGYTVRTIVRSPHKIPGDLQHHDQLHLIHVSLLELSDAELQRHLQDCTAVVSCLGHTLDFKGIWGKPRRLVTDAVRRLSQAVVARGGDRVVKIILMNTCGVPNPDAGERVSTGERIVTGLLRVAVPPHADNEQAAAFLRKQIGPGHPQIEWVVVRPDTLTTDTQTSPYSVYPSPTRSAIFNAGKTSRTNVAAFMTKLLSDEATWEEWKGRMPALYNS